MNKHAPDALLQINFVLARKFADAPNDLVRGPLLADLPVFDVAYGGLATRDRISNKFLRKPFFLQLNHEVLNVHKP